MPSHTSLIAMEMVSMGGIRCWQYARSTNPSFHRSIKSTAGGWWFSILLLPSFILTCLLEPPSSAPSPPSMCSPVSGLVLAAVCLVRAFALQPSVLDLYRHALRSRPMLTNMLTASALSVVSDAFAQSMERRKARGSLTNELSSSLIPRHSFYRSSTMAVYGAGVFGWFVSHWFRWLNGLFPLEGMTLQRLLAKIFVNQFFMSPFLNALFFSWVVFTRDYQSSFKEKRTTLSHKLANDLLPTIQRSCIYWSFVHLVNFSVIPYKYQLIYTNLGFLFWTIYLSIVGYRQARVPKPSDG